MKINIKNNTIELKGKVINNLDKFVLGLVEILNRHVKYVIVSGYVVIFFGRARATEDIDVLIEKKNMRKFFEEVCRKGYWLVNTNNIDDALDILNKGNAEKIR